MLDLAQTVAPPSEARGLQTQCLLSEENPDGSCPTSITRIALLTFWPTHNVPPIPHASNVPRFLEKRHLATPKRVSSRPIWNQPFIFHVCRSLVKAICDCNRSAP